MTFEDDAKIQRYCKRIGATMDDVIHLMVKEYLHRHRQRRA